MSEAWESIGFAEVRRLFRQACSRPPAQRCSFLALECGTRREVLPEFLREREE